MGRAPIAELAYIINAGCIAKYLCASRGVALYNEPYRNPNPAFSLYLMVSVAPSQGQSNILVYLAICSAFGSLSVTSCKALGIALRLTFGGSNQVGIIDFCT